MNNYKINHQKNDKTKEHYLIFSGELSFSLIAQIKEETESLLIPNTAYHITTKDVEIIDLSFIQFIISLKALHEDSQISLELTQEFKQLLQNTGFKNLIK
ncbi:MAG: hypothetical protein B7C24_04885 [Bacteroidetes bacterium 4572_77]|nr:MAG: hypothetical protein B7C24_04885 [Bacteroidetes bacterium 4572_77]